MPIKPSDVGSGTAALLLLAISANGAAATLSPNDGPAANCVP